MDLCTIQRLPMPRLLDERARWPLLVGRINSVGRTMVLDIVVSPERGLSLYSDTVIGALSGVPA